MYMKFKLFTYTYLYTFTNSFTILKIVTVKKQVRKKELYILHLFAEMAFMQSTHTYT